MTPSRRRARTAISGAAAVLAAATAASVPFAATSAGAQSRQCFRAMDWHGSAAGGPHDLYVRVGMHDIWRLEMKEACPAAHWPGPVSLTDIVSPNSNEICSGVDLQITVRPRGGGVASPCIVTSMTKLTADEAKALPKKAVPD